MSLEQKVTEKKSRIIRRAPSSEALNLLKQGKKFIPVEKAFDVAYLPDDYMLIDMQYKDESFKTIVPMSVMIYMSNPGEGDLDDALDEITDFYDEVKDFEDDLLEDNDHSIQGTNWAVTARSSYSTYLTNKLTKGNDEDIDTPEWNEKTLEKLDIQDDFVDQRIKAIAGVALGMSIEQVKKYNIKDVLKHVTVNERKTETLNKEEFDKITCWAGSHYEIKDEYKNNNDVEYQIEYEHDEDYKVGTKTIKKQEVEVFDAKIDELESEINTYRKEKHKNIETHDKNLIRQYINIGYISKENPNAQLPVTPPNKKE